MRAGLSTATRVVAAYSEHSCQGTVWLGGYNRILKVTFGLALQIRGQKLVTFKLNCQDMNKRLSRLSKMSLLRNLSSPFDALFGDSQTGEVAGGTHEDSADEDDYDETDCEDTNDGQVEQDDANGRESKRSFLPS